MMYFADCKSESELESAYRQQSKALHPDMGGNADAFVAMKQEYNERKIFFKYLDEYRNRHGLERTVDRVVVKRKIVNVGEAVQTLMHNKDAIADGISALSRIARDMRHAVKQAQKKKPLY